MYRAPAGSWRRLGRFFLLEFPRLYRAAAPFILTATLLFALPAMAAYLVVLASPPTAEQLLPPRLTRTVREGRLWTQISPEERSLASSTIMTNNLQVAILAFAGGILLGTLSVYVLVSNGLLLGAVFGYTQAHGLATDLAAFVSPHGYVELSVVFIAGGAGLQMAWALLSPGLLGRRDALALAARRAVLLLVGAAPLLVIAGLIEGFVSPSDLPRELKLLLGPLTALALYAFLLRRPPSAVTVARAP
ncbi:MAG: stage II sporulation protein M [Chloroflexi bacterium]|nr:stage II sporulation protein M [Chloroflexota bacterium]